MKINLDQPVENPKLKELLRERVNKPQEEQLAVMNQIAQEVAMNAYFLIILDVKGSAVERKEDGSLIFQKGTKLSFPHLETEDGMTVLPLFTDWEELRKWEPFRFGKVDTLIVPFDEVYSFVESTQAPVVIDPFGDSFMMPFAMLDHIRKVKAGKSRPQMVQKQVVKEDTKVAIGQPKKYPMQMVNAIRAYAEGVPAIKAIWLKMMLKDGEESFLIIVDADGDASAYFSGIARAAEPYRPKKTGIYMVPTSEAFGRDTATGEPFYIRD